MFGPFFPRDWSRQRHRGWGRGFGHFDENIRIKNLDRDCVDLNVHFFATSHFEAILNARAEFIGLCKGGPTGAYAFLQGHYRL